jgi:AAA domain
MVVSVRYPLDVIRTARPIMHQVYTNSTPLGAITIIAAPRGTGKSVTALALAIALASGGVFRQETLPPTPVLLVDRDNPPAVVRKRLQWLGATAGHTLDVLIRDDAPPLTDKTAWASFPVEKYAAVIIDSLGTATEGVSEKEGRQTQEFLATLKDLAHRGPAILALDNTNKAATSYRGRGEKADAVDILYEARDITDWTPSTADAWWESLPEYGDHAWQQRATRCKGQKVLRIAFIPSKFRLGIEPEPFAIEIDTTTTPWTLGVIALFPTTWQGEKLLNRRQSGMLPSMSPLGLARGDLAWNGGSA